MKTVRWLDGWKQQFQRHSGRKQSDFWLADGSDFGVIAPREPLSRWLMSRVTKSCANVAHYTEFWWNGIHRWSSPKQMVGTESIITLMIFFRSTTVPNELDDKRGSTLWQLVVDLMLD